MNNIGLRWAEARLSGRTGPGFPPFAFLSQHFYRLRPDISGEDPGRER